MRLDNILDNIEEIVFDSVQFFENLYIAFSEYCYLFYNASSKTFDLIVLFVTELIKSFYTELRYLTIPFNFAIVWIWDWYITKNSDKEPLDEIGVHYVQSLPGGGKSSLAKHKADEFMHKYGRSSYITHAFEKTKKDDDGNKYVYHRLVDLKDYYGERKKLKRFNFKKYYALFIDEFHLLNNNRFNKEKTYNDFFKALLDDLIAIRHTDMDRAYILSQLPSNDVQLMAIIAYYHVIKMKKGINYWRWIETGRFERVPLKWRIKTYTIEPETLKRVMYRRWSESCQYGISR